MIDLTQFYRRQREGEREKEREMERMTDRHRLTVTDNIEREARDESKEEKKICFTCVFHTVESKRATPKNVN